MVEQRKDVQKFKGNPMTLTGNAPKVGMPAPDFKLVKNDLSTVSLENYRGKVKIINVVPSLDTPVCDRQGRRFNEEAARLGGDIVVLVVSRDLPFAQKRWCGAGNDRVETLSDFRDGSFGPSYGLAIHDGPLAGLLARAVFVVDRDNKLVYQQVTPELAQEPDYEPVLEAARKAAG